MLISTSIRGSLLAVSFAGWWEETKEAFAPEFVEFVEEQRSKAA